MGKTNIEELNDVLQETTSLKGVIPKLETQADVEALHTRISTMPNDKSDFYSALTKVIAKHQFNKGVFNNPLGELTQGRLSYGDGIGNVFVNMLESKAYGTHWDNETTDADTLVKSLPPKLSIDYITTNIDRAYKVTINDVEGRKCFYDVNGVADLKNTITSRIQASINRDMYKDTLKCLTSRKIENDNTDGARYSVGLIRLAEKESTNKTNMLIEIDTGQPDYIKTLATKIRTYANVLTFPSNKYNVAKVETYTDKQDLVFISPSDVNAQISVDLLAMAFNVDMANTTTRNIVVDDLGNCDPTGSSETGTKKVLGILMDKNAVVNYLSYENMSSFVVPSLKNTVNLFANRTSAIAPGIFSNFIVFHAK